jgi:hypothetical protein
MGLGWRRRGLPFPFTGILLFRIACFAMFDEFLYSINFQ